ncbi:hypothetical protein MHU86_19493 [Fragilaria crotonensis]|nr:hypothetical protein MHU86_19493 [Fragilaria crotonensis]
MMMNHRKTHLHPIPQYSLPSRQRDKREPKLAIPTYLIFLSALLFGGLSLAALFLPEVQVHEDHPLSVVIMPRTSPSNPTTSHKLINNSASLRWTYSNNITKQQSGSKQSTTQYHIVFSTSCSDQQHWESYVLFYHAYKVGQHGNVTRLLSGCGTKEEEEQRLFHQTHIQTLSPNFHVHFTPDFSMVRHHRDANKKEHYKYMNKPFSLKHWFEHVLGYNESKANTHYDDDVVFLIDPDMILIKPLTHDFRDDPTVELIGNPAGEYRYVHRGHPMAQQDGYLRNEWMNLDMKKITLVNQTPALHVKENDGPVHWNSGPPYLFTAVDGYQIASHWVEFAPRVHRQFPKLFAEMFGYIIATAYLGMPHTLIKSLVVSSTTSSSREGWSFVDSIPDPVCLHHSTVKGIFALHYCGRYLLGKKWFWSKYRHRKDFMECHVPLLQVPPPSIQDEREAFSPPPVHTYKGTWTQEHKIISERQAKREAYMLCALIAKVNEAVEYFKRNTCGDAGNYSKVYNIHEDPG